MSAPTTSVLLNQVTPAAPSGDQNVTFVSDGGTPLQSITAYPKTATASLRGVVKPDDTTITIASGVITAATQTATGSAGGDLSGSYPDPTVAKVNGAAVPASAAFVGTNSSKQLVATSAVTAVTGLGAISSSGGTAPVITVDIASAGSPGVVLPDGSVITVNPVNGLITVPTATDSALGVAQADGLSIFSYGGIFSAAPATAPTLSPPSAGTLGIVKPDGTTITISSGVISAVSGVAGINQLTGDVTAGPGIGSQVATVVKVNGAALPATAAVVGTNGAGQIISSVLPILIGFAIGNGTVGTNVGPMLASPRASSVTKCVVTTKASDSLLGLVFRIKKNGTNVFSSNPSLVAGTGSGTVTVFTSLTSSPLAVALSDVFSLDILTGSSNWQFAAQME